MCQSTLKRTDSTPLRAIWEVSPLRPKLGVLATGRPARCRRTRRAPRAGRRRRRRGRPARRPTGRTGGERVSRPVYTARPSEGAAFSCAISTRSSSRGGPLPAEARGPPRAPAARRCACRLVVLDQVRERVREAFRVARVDQQRGVRRRSPAVRSPRRRPRGCRRPSPPGTEGRSPRRARGPPPRGHLRRGRAGAPRPRIPTAYRVARPPRACSRARYPPPPAPRPASRAAPRPRAARPGSCAPRASRPRARTVARARGRGGPARDRHPAGIARPRPAGPPPPGRARAPSTSISSPRPKADAVTSSRALRASRGSRSACQRA